MYTAYDRECDELAEELDKLIKKASELVSSNIHGCDEYTTKDKIIQVNKLVEANDSLLRPKH